MCLFHRFDLRPATSQNWQLRLATNCVWWLSLLAYLIYTRKHNFTSVLSLKSMHTPSPTNKNQFHTNGKIRHRTQFITFRTTERHIRRKFIFSGHLLSSCFQSDTICYNWTGLDSLDTHRPDVNFNRCIYATNLKWLVFFVMSFVLVTSWLPLSNSL